MPPGMQQGAPGQGETPGNDSSSGGLYL
jgi:hypothetical protein